MLKYEIKEGRAAVEDITDIYEGCTLNLKWSNPHTLKSFTEKEKKEAFDFLKESISVLEKSGKFYYYTEIYLEEVECTENGREEIRNAIGFTKFPNDPQNALIKKLRLSAGLTQKQFAKKYGISLASVKSWDCGRRTPPAWAVNLLIEKMSAEQEDNEKKYG